MTQNRDQLKTVEKLERENQELRTLLESAETELKTFLAQSQEESQQLQKVLQRVYPKIRDKLQRARSESKTVAVQTDDDQVLLQNFEQVQECFKEVEKQVVDLIKHKKILELELLNAQECEKKLQMELETDEIVIKNMQYEIDEGLKFMQGVQDLNYFIDAQVRFQRLLGVPGPGLLQIFNAE